MHSINILLQLLGDFVPIYLGTIISMSLRVLATLGRLYKRIFKRLITQPRIYEPFIIKYVFLYTYINMFIYIHKALLLPTSMNRVNCA